MQEKLKLSTKGSVALGLVGEAMLTGIVTSYLVYFGTDILGLSALVMGNILLVSRIFDGVTDLGFGVVMENTHTKAGKARPWVLRTCIPFAIFSVLIFCIPISWNTTTKIVGLFLGYNLYALAYTGLAIATNSLNVLICQDSKNRLSISSIMFGSAVAGNTIINMIAVSALAFFSGTADGTFTQGGFARLATVLAIVSGIGGILTYMNTTEVVQTEQKEKQNPLKGIGTLFKNKYWLLQTGNGLAHFFALYCRLTTMVYYA